MFKNDDTLKSRRFLLGKRSFVNKKIINMLFLKCFQRFKTTVTMDGQSYPTAFAMNKQDSKKRAAINVLHKLESMGHFEDHVKNIEVVSILTLVIRK